MTKIIMAFKKKTRKREINNKNYVKINFSLIQSATSSYPGPVAPPRAEGAPLNGSKEV